VNNPSQQPPLQWETIGGAMRKAMIGLALAMAAATAGAQDGKGY
jgi:hypothetical protein